MTHTAAVSPRPEPVTSRTTEAAAEFPLHRTVAAHVVGGLAGVLRVVSLLHSRRYPVRNLRIDVRDGVVESRVECTVWLTATATALLLERLNRMPAVVSAENV
ncbi:Uncharacterised protein [Amycolatopsis camponoti]|uniref:Uncharacterized protein n=1 Tax=Amycolatopsis camponoti TaxID=2606593 RepID=A0A6I8LP73_9PSEU|nr:hypothetical protein [Amycolatopsis camponoti]VVJ17495.1 Uncharacterised protein [Amycolatopsis camponoti]